MQTLLLSLDVDDKLELDFVLSHYLSVYFAIYLFILNF